MLHVGETVKLERIKVFLIVHAGFFVAKQHLRFGFNFEFTQLLAQAVHSLRQFQQIEVDRVELQFDTRPVNRHFTGVVD